MTDEEMLQATIERIKQADMADLSAIYEYLVWSQARYTLWAQIKAKATPNERLTEEKCSEALLDQDAIEKNKGE